MTSQEQINALRDVAECARALLADLKAAGDRPNLAALARLHINERELINSLFGLDQADRWADERPRREPSAIERRHSAMGAR